MYRRGRFWFRSSYKADTKAALSMRRYYQGKSLPQRKQGGSQGRLGEFSVCSASLIRAKARGRQSRWESALRSCLSKRSSETEGWELPTKASHVVRKKVCLTSLQAPSLTGTALVGVGTAVAPADRWWAVLPVERPVGTHGWWRHSAAPTLQSSRNGRHSPESQSPGHSASDLEI